MDKVKILHCGDLHFDTPFQGLEPIEAEKRKEDLRETFGRIIDLVKSESIPILLMAGDVFDNDGVTKMTMDYIDKKLKQIPETKVFISPGNHDYYSDKSFYSIHQWPKNVHVFKDKVEKIVMPELNTCIYGVGFLKKHEKQSLINDFIVDDENMINIMLLHGDVVSSGQASDYNPITEDNIRDSKLDYLALGHKHGFSGIKKSGKTSWAYSGNPEGRGFDELGPKGIIIGEIGKSWCHLDFVEISKRKHLEVEVDISGALSYDDIVDKIKEKIPQEGRTNLFKIILTGEVDKELSLYTKVIEDKLQDYFYFVKIHNLSKISIDFFQLEKEYSLKGIYTRKIREKMQRTKESSELELLELALKMGLKVLDKGKVEIE